MANMKATDTDTSRRTLKFFLLSATLIICCIVVFVVAASYLVVRPLHFTAPQAYSISATITFEAEVISADATSRTLVMDWYPQFAFNPCYSNISTVADIYLDPGLLDSSSPSFSSVPPLKPAARLNATSICEGPVPVNRGFRTVSKLLSSYYDPVQGAAHSSLQKYPFDVYLAPFSLYAQDHNTGALIPVNVTNSFGIAVNFEVSLQRSFMLNDRLYMSMRVKRSRATQTFVVLVAIANWLITGAFLTICAATMIYKNHRYYTEMFVVPVGALFAFTSIRANLPGAPAGYGATIDLYSILPVLIIMASCSVFLLLTILYRRLHDTSEHGIVWDRSLLMDRGVMWVDEKESTKSVRSQVKDPELEMKADAVDMAEAKKSITSPNCGSFSPTCGGFCTPPSSIGGTFSRAGTGRANSSATVIGTDQSEKRSIDQTEIERV